MTDELDRALRNKRRFQPKQVRPPNFHD
jgi:hypothetical protein